VAEEGGAIRDRGCAAYVRGIVSVTVAMDVARRRRVRRVMRVVLTYPGGGTLVDVGQGEVARRGRTRSARSPRALLREELADVVRSRQALRAENGELFFVPRGVFGAFPDGGQYREGALYARSIPRGTVSDIHTSFYI
jgi:hypothetical protein